MNKDTIYIDVDEDITGIIEKVKNSREKIIALVLPKRAAVLQSIVNMKLLKRTAEDEKKRVVLITSETGLMPLAGAVGLHVAKTLQSKPFVPEPPVAPEEAVAASVSRGEKGKKLDPSKSIGELAGLPASKEESIEVDNTEAEPVDGAEGAQGAGAAGVIAKVKKSRKLKVPNFGKFRTRLLLGIGLLILLIIGWIYGFMVMPEAHVTVKTDASPVTSTLQLTASAEAQTVNKEQMIIPAKLEEIKKTDTEKVPATGEKNIGEKATGTLTLRNCERVDGSITIPAGTGASSGNMTFIIQETVRLPASSFTGGGTCNTPTEEVDVVAQNAGDQYNLASGRNYAVAGHSNVRATGSAMTGGTSEVVKIITEADIDSAKEKISQRAPETVTDELLTALEAAGMLGVEDSFSSGDPAITTSPNVGDEATEVTVTAVTTYTMLGVNREDLQSLLKDDMESQIDTERQAILDTGLEDAAIRVSDRPSPTNLRLNIQSVGLAGPDVDVEALREEVAGKKKGEVINIIQEHPGVTEVTVDYKPFWVTTTPKKAEKITIVFEEPPRPTPVADDADSEQ